MNMNHMNMNILNVCLSMIWYDTETAYWLHDELAQCVNMFGYQGKLFYNSILSASSDIIDFIWNVLPFCHQKLFCSALSVQIWLSGEIWIRLGYIFRIVPAVRRNPQRIYVFKYANMRIIWFRLNEIQIMVLSIFLYYHLIY